MTYLKAKSAAAITFGHDLSSAFPENIEDYDCIVYTVGLGKNLLLHRHSLTELQNESKYNRIYDSDHSYILIKTKNVQP
jgi:hypothetical protein